MTNSLNTPIEALESSLPVTVSRYTIRRATGGKGRQPGGDGVVRALRFEVPSELSLLTERRVFAPRGVHGGGDGAPGRNSIVSANGRRRSLPGKGNFHIAAGDTLVIETPGGGGFGRKR